MTLRSTVVAAPSREYTRSSIARAVSFAIDHMEPSLPSLVRRGDRVLLKVNMGCNGLKRPEQRFSTHPFLAEFLAKALRDCGARVAIGDDGAQREPRHLIWKATEMTEAAKRSGAELVDFVKSGVVEVSSGLAFPRTYLLSRAVADADTVVNAANFRSHATLVLSGAVKNLFGTVVGDRKRALHGLFPDAKAFCRVLADICRVARPAVSFLDLTTVLEGHGVNNAVRPVGLILAGAHPVALDVVAAAVVGYDRFRIWTSIHGAMMGLGPDNLADIEIRGLEWQGIRKTRLAPPYIARAHSESLWAKVTRRINNTVLRPRPAVLASSCRGCGHCHTVCPAEAIRMTHSRKYAIDSGKCVDCLCCIKVCDHNTVRLEHGRFTRVARALAHTTRHPVVARATS